jgi:cell division protein FtsB
MPTQETRIDQELEQRMKAFEAANPDIVEAMKVLNLNSRDYLEALARVQGGGSMSGNGFVGS